MPLWNGNDRESSKPSWLTEEQKRQCFRTVRGWEIPLAGFGSSADAESVYGLTSMGVTPGSSSNMIGPNLYRSPTYASLTELLVAMPWDASATGTTNSNLAGYGTNEFRGATATGWASGVTNYIDGYNYTPYITTPFTGQSFTIPRGTTAYIPVIASDANYTDLPRRMTFSLTTVGAGTTWPAFSVISSVTAGSFGPSGASWLNQPTYLIGSTATSMVSATGANLNYNTYGGLGGITAGSALMVFTVTAGATTGTFPYSVRVNDGHSVGSASLTGTSTFTLIVV